MRAIARSSAVYLCEFSMVDTAASNPPAIEFDGVSYTYPGSPNPAIENISLRVEQGERLGILGPNGGGKSTLLKLAMGLLEGYSGDIRIFGDCPRHAKRQGRIASVLQSSPPDLRFPMSVWQVVEIAATHRLSPWRRPSADIRKRVAQSLALVGMERHAQTPIGAISGGELQRALIARAVAAASDILTLDEPTVGVDIAGQEQFAKLLDAIHAEMDVTILIVSHDLRAIAAACDQVACLARTIHFHDAPNGLTPQILADVFQHDVSGAFGDVHVEAHRAEDCPGDHAHSSEDRCDGEASS